MVGSKLYWIVCGWTAVLIKMWMLEIDTSCVGMKHRDVYHIGSIVSYQYHKTDTSMISKWQINDTFNDTFYDDINKDRASLTQKWMIFFYLIDVLFFIFTSFGKLWSLNTVILYAEYTKRPKGKKWIFNGLVSYRILSVSFCQYRYCIVS